VAHSIPPTIRIASYPEQTLNPYQRLFYGALRPYGVEAFDFRHVDDAMLAEPQFNVLHFHWSVEVIWRTRATTGLAAVRALVGWWRFLRKARTRGIRVVWTIHEMHAEQETWQDRIGFSILSRATDLFICHSGHSRQDLIRAYGADPARIVVIPHGSYDGVYPEPAPKQATIARLGLDPALPLLVCFGYLRPRKGLETAIAAVKALEGRFQLLITGKSTNSESEKWLAGVHEAAAAGTNIHVVARKLSDQELADIIHAADCVLLPYLEIVTSGSLAACATFGRAVVASDLPFFSEMLAREPLAGVLTTPGDSASLRRSIEDFFSVPITVRHEAARRLADHWNWHDVVRPVGEWLVQNTVPVHHGR